jgi:hypothetical protein
LNQPLSFDGFIAGAKTGSEEVLAHIQSVLASMQTPAWLGSVPKNYGEAAAGTIKAAEWKLLATLFLPVALVTLWGDSDDSSEDAVGLKQALKNAMSLFQAVIIACKWRITRDRAEVFRELLKDWVDNLRTVFPHVRDHAPRTNMHISFHLYDFFYLFGPMVSWWSFPFERLIGVLERVPTNDHIGGEFFSALINTFSHCMLGEMEYTIMKSQQEAANLRRWLRRPNCPPVIKEIKTVFDQIFAPASATQVLPWENESALTKASERAHYVHEGFNYSRGSTHEGNSLIFFQSLSEASPIPAKICRIVQERPPGAGNQSPLEVFFMVNRYMALSQHARDPFTEFPHLQARVFSSSLDKKPEKIRVNQVVSHATRYDFSDNRSVFVNLVNLTRF